MGVLSDEKQTLADLNKPIRPIDPDWPRRRTEAQVSSRLKMQGYTNDEQSSYWKVLQAKFNRGQGRPFCHEKGTQPLPTIRREYDVDSVRQMRIDHADRVLIHTSAGSGLGVTCIDTGKLLWSDKGVPVYGNFLEYSEGWVITTECMWLDRKFQIWYFERLSTTVEQPQRGNLRAYRELWTPQPVVKIRFHYPYFVGLTNEFHVICMDVRSRELISDFNVKPDEDTCGSPYGVYIQDVEFDDEYIYTLITGWWGDELNNSYGPPDPHETYPWVLQAWSRQTHRVVWQLKKRNLSIGCSMTEHEYHFDDKDDKKDDGEWQRPISMQTTTRRPCGMPFAMQVDDTTASLCLTFDAGLIVFPHYKGMTSGEVPTSTNEFPVPSNASSTNGSRVADRKANHRPIYLNIARPYVKRYKGDRDPEADQLSVGGGLACFDIDDSIVLVDLQAVLSGQPENALVRLIRPEIDPWTRPYSYDDCSMHVDETMLAFYSWAPPKEGAEARKAWDRGKPTNITLYDFAEIGRSRVEAKEPQTETKVLKLSAEDVSESSIKDTSEKSMEAPTQASVEASSQASSDEGANKEEAAVVLSTRGRCGCELLNVSACSQYDC